MSSKSRYEPFIVEVDLENYSLNKNFDFASELIRRAALKQINPAFYGTFTMKAGCNNFGGCGGCSSPNQSCDDDDNFDFDFDPSDNCCSGCNTKNKDVCDECQRVVTQRKKDGVCVRCGHKGDWINMALICPKHGKIIG
jgi:hypothetical protein